MKNDLERGMKNSLPKNLKFFPWRFSKLRERVL
jgi:hypothetical protein